MKYTKVDYLPPSAHEHVWSEEKIGTVVLGTVQDGRVRWQKGAPTTRPVHYRQCECGQIEVADHA